MDWSSSGCVGVIMDGTVVPGLNPVMLGEDCLGIGMRVGRFLIPEL